MHRSKIGGDDGGCWHEVFLNSKNNTIGNSIGVQIIVLAQPADRRAPFWFQKLVGIHAR